MKTKGITLIEVVVVTAIVAVLAMVAWLVLGPSMRVRGLETRIRSDLKQIVSAINIYMADHDGQYPLRRESLPKTIAWSIPGLPRHGSVGGGQMGGNFYWYTFIVQQQRYDAKFARYRFAPEADPIVKGQMLRRDTKMRVNEVDFFYPCREEIRSEKNLLVLGARLDGSIDWFPVYSTFEREFATCSWKLGDLRK